MATKENVIKRTLKRLLPPPTASIMRESRSIRRGQRKIMKSISELERLVSSFQESTEGRFDVIERLSRSFDSLNRENRRLHDELQKNNEVLEETNQRLCDELQKNNEVLGETNRRLSTIESLLLASSEKQDEYLDPALYEHAIKQWYLKTTGRILDLNNPKTYNEKIQWAKLNDRDPLRSRLTDKYLVREWVADKIGEQYLIPLLGVYSNENDIEFDELPNSFVAKATHGSGWNRIVRNKDSEDFAQIRRQLHDWLRRDYTFSFGFELHYRNIERRIVIERYLENSDGDLPDYKFWCFDGKVEFIQYLSNRRNGLRMTFFNRQWEKQAFRYDHPGHDVDIEKPACLDEMIGIAETLAAGFPHVRVDLYLHNRTDIYFGEMTFTSCSGASIWNPWSADLLLGELYHLPID